MRRTQGFTLIELMVTIAVAAILLSLALPSFRNMIVTSRLNSVSAELTDAIGFARFEAIKRNRTIVFCRVANETATNCATGANWSHWVVGLRTGANSVEVVRRGEVNTYGGSLRVTSQMTNSRVVFNGDGLARSDNGNLITDTTGRMTVCANSGPSEGTRRITMGAASRMSVERITGFCS